MSSAIGDIPKRPNYSNGLKTLRPSNFGLPKSGKHSRRLSPEALASFKKLAAMRKKATMLAIAEEIIAFYKPGWPELLPAQKGSRAAIVQTLLRQGRVTATKYPVVITKILESLARAGKIKLPPKIKKGGARQKKK